MPLGMSPTCWMRVKKRRKRKKKKKAPKLTTQTGQLWIDHPSFPVAGHKFTGYYFTYPSGAQERQQQQQKPHLGLVSTVADDPPMLNWIFVDKDSGVVRHGGRQDTLGGHTTGPWYWSDDEQWLTLGGDAGRFVAVQLEGKKWAVAWDHGAGEEGEERNFGGRGGRREPLVGEGEGEGECDGECDGSGTELGTETEQTGHQNGELEGSRLPASRRLPRKWVPVMLRRKMQLGMESRYVKGENG